MVQRSQPGRGILGQVPKECLNLRVLQERFLEMQGNVCKVPAFRDAGVEHGSYLRTVVKLHSIVAAHCRTVMSAYLW
jgi:hypothetical protein